MSKCKVIDIARQKGGKHATTVNLGIGIAKQKAYGLFMGEVLKNGERQRNQHESSQSR